MQWVSSVTSTPTNTHVLQNMDEAIGVLQSALDEIVEERGNSWSFNSLTRIKEDCKDEINFGINLCVFCSSSLKRLFKRTNRQNMHFSTFNSTSCAPKQFAYSEELLGRLSDHSVQLNQWVDTFCDVRAAIVKKMVEVQERIEKGRRCRGLASLPDEILAYILELVTPDGGDPGGCFGPTYLTHAQHSLQLAAVCRRFRSIMFATPSRWNVITSELSLDPEIVSVFLSRCGPKGATLHLDMNRWEGIDRCANGDEGRWGEKYNPQGRLSEILATSAHQVSCVDFRGDIGDFVGALEMCRGHSFVNLVALDLNYCPARINESLDMTTTSPVSRSFQILERNAPNLSFVAIANYDISKERPIPTLPYSVKELHLRSVLPSSITLDSWDAVHQFLKYIERSQELAELRADLDLSPVEGHIAPHAATWQMTSLSLVLRYSGRMPLLSLNFPNLKDFDLSLTMLFNLASSDAVSDDPSPQDAWTLFLCELFSVNKLPVLRTLKISDRRSGISLHGSFFRHCLRLEHLELTLNGEVEDLKLPTSLQSLTFVNSTLGEATIETIRQLFEESDIPTSGNVINCDSDRLNVTIQNAIVVAAAFELEEKWNNIKCEQKLLSPIRCRIPTDVVDCTVFPL